MTAPRVALAAAGLLSLACSVTEAGDDADGGDGGFSAQGQMTSATDGVLAMIWSVPSATPEYAYRFGSVTAVSPTSFIVSLPSAPPDDAVNADGIGVGVVVLFQPGTQVPAGKLPQSLGSAVLGFTAQHAIVYRKPGASSERWWADGFEDGLSCGKCSPPPAGEAFDGFVPTSCSSLALVLNPAQSCDWT